MTMSAFASTRIPNNWSTSNNPQQSSPTGHYPAAEKAALNSNAYESYREETRKRRRAAIERRNAKRILLASMYRNDLALFDGLEPPTAPSSPSSSPDEHYSQDEERRSTVSRKITSDKPALKKMVRKMKNRASAEKSRRRRLQEVDTLKRTIEQLQRSHDTIRETLARLEEENRILRAGCQSQEPAANSPLFVRDSHLDSASTSNLKGGNGTSNISPIKNKATLEHTSHTEFNGAEESAPAAGDRWKTEPINTSSQAPVGISTVKVASLEAAVEEAVKEWLLTANLALLSHPSSFDEESKKTISATEALNESPLDYRGHMSPSTPEAMAAAAAYKDQQAVSISEESWRMPLVLF